MCLSDATLEGLRMTGKLAVIHRHIQCIPNFSLILVNAFVEMTEYLLKHEGVKFLLSERFCQDPVEEFFGNQRAKGGRCDNPTAKDFCDTTVSIRVQKTAALHPLRGNCSKRQGERTIEIDSTPLKKRKRCAVKF